MRITSWLLTLLLCCSAFAEPSLRFERIGLNQGLSQSSVYTMLQDSQGFIWVGTQDGLNRYDGYEFKVFRHQAGDPNSLPDNDVTALLQEDDSHLWVGTNVGLCLFNLAINRFNCFRHKPGDPRSLSADRIHSLAKDVHGNLWVGTYGGGINIFNAKSQDFDHLRFDPKDPNSLSDDDVDVIVKDSESKMWVGTYGNGLNRYDGKQNGFTRFVYSSSDPKSLSNNKVTDIFEDGQGTLWVATIAGLNRFNPETVTFDRYTKGANSLGDDRVWKLHEDRKGQLWLAHESGIDRLDRQTGQFEHFIHQTSDLHSISHNSVHSILEDHNGLLWFGTYGGGINRHNPATEQFGHIKRQPWKQNTLSNNMVLSFYINGQNQLWIGTDGGGVNILDLSSGQWQHMKMIPGDHNSLAGNTVRSIFKDSKGKMWFSIWNVGLSTYIPETDEYKHYLADLERKNNKANKSDSHSLLSSTTITRFHEDPYGFMWMTSYGEGLYRFDPLTEAFENITLERTDDTSTLGSDRITEFWADEQGKFWLGSDAGLIKFDPKTRRSSLLKHIPGDGNSLTNNNVTSIFKDSRDMLWIGTYGGGLNLFDPVTSSFRHFRYGDGLANDSIYSIAEDKLGDLWISTNKGLSRFDVANESFTNFNELDGLQSNEFNALASIRSKDGELFFGGINGFNRFFGDRIRQKGLPPKVVFTDLLRFNQSMPVMAQSENGKLQLRQTIDRTTHLSLSHTDSLITFRFAALDFANPGANQYRYRLDGFDTQWITTGADNRRATYTSLPSGKYTLTVKAANAHGIWNEEGTSIDLHVSAPPWQSWWALAAYGLIFTMLILMLVYVGFEKRKIQYERAANKQLKQMDQIKDAFLTNTAIQLRTPLNGIIGLAQSLVDGVAGNLPEKAEKNLAMVVSSGRRLSNLINDIVDFSKLSNDSLALNNRPLDLYSLADVVLNITKPLLGGKELLMANRVPKDLPKVMADEIRLQQVLYNLVDNAIKFTPKGSISIAATLLDEQIEVTVIDTGIGISKEKLKLLFDKNKPQGRHESLKENKGLGLTIAKQLLRLHDSSIKVQSQVGQGSTFSFTLPAWRGSAQEPFRASQAKEDPFTPNEFRGFEMRKDHFDLPGLREQSEEASRFKLLLVDDEAVTLEVLHDHLSLQNYQLVITQHPEKALELLEQQGPFDLMVTDIMMSGMSGFELCKKVRKTYPIHDLPIILLSNRSEAEDLAQCFTVGANDCLSKPISRHELLIRVASHLKMLDITRNLERKVAERTEELEQEKFKVEQKVAQRTADLEQSNRSLSALSQICSEISAILEWDKLMLSVYEHIKELMETEVFLIGLYQPERQRVAFELAIECDELLPNSFIAMYEKNRPAVWCIENSQPLIINDIDEEFSYYFGDLPVPEPKVGGRPLSFVFWPLMSGGRTLGVLSVQSFHKNAYTYSELEVIRTVASTTAIALDNAQAYREIEMQKSAVEAKVAQRTEQLELKNKEILETQQQLVQSEKMASLGTLTAGVAHEINNPTNFVHVSAQNLEVDLSKFEQFILALAGDDADEEILESLEQQFKPLHEHITTIKDGTSRIKTIVKDLRAFTHLDADDKQLVRICETLESTINLTKTQFLELAEVVTNFEGDPELLCYPAQLSQVFMNLIVNACDAIREKQALSEVSERGKITISLKQNKDIIEIAFKDNGMGMNEVTQNKLFEPFYTTKAVGEGTGLGLSISYNIIEKHQGEMRVTSALGEGTTFTLLLPLSTD